MVFQITGNVAYLHVFPATFLFGVKTNKMRTISRGLALHMSNNQWYKGECVYIFFYWFILKRIRQRDRLVTILAFAYLKRRFDRPQLLMQHHCIPHTLFDWGLLGPMVVSYLALEMPATSDSLWACSGTAFALWLHSPRRTMQYFIIKHLLEDYRDVYPTVTQFGVHGVHCWNVPHLCGTF